MIYTHVIKMFGSSGFFNSSLRTFFQGCHQMPQCSIQCPAPLRPVSSYKDSYRVNNYRITDIRPILDKPKLFLMFWTDLKSVSYLTT